MIEIDVNMY